MYQRVLVPLDGSELAEQAIDTALRTLDDKGTLLLCRILLSDARHGFEMIDFESMREKEEKVARDYLDGVVKRLNRPDLNVETIVKPAPVAEAIMTAIKESDVELVVLCSHGRSGMSRWFLGSVAERVVRLSPCPVLVCKNRPDS